MMRARDGMLTLHHKFLGFAVSRLNPYEDELEKVEISYKDYCNLTGEKFENKHYQRFYKAARKALKRNIFIETGDGDEWIDYTLCPTVRGKSGKVWITFNHDLKSHFIEVKERFSKIGLDTYFSLRRDYSAGFYELLKTREMQADKNKRFFVDITVEEIRQKFQLGDKYKQYRDLKRRVILDALNEINDKTELKFLSLEETGRPVERIRIWAVKGKPRAIISKLPEAKQEDMRLDDKDKISHTEAVKILESREHNFGSEEMWLQSKTMRNLRKFNGIWVDEGPIKEPEIDPDSSVKLSEKQKKIVESGRKQGLLTSADEVELKEKPNSVVGRILKKFRKEKA